MFWTAIILSAPVALAFCFLAVGARYDETTDNTPHNSREIDRQVLLTEGVAFHTDFTNAEGPKDHA